MPREGQRQHMHMVERSFRGLSWKRGEEREPWPHPPLTSPSPHLTPESRPQVADTDSVSHTSVTSDRFKWFGLISGLCLYCISKL